MRTLDQLKAHALAIAEMHFYSDVHDATPWEPFEHHDAEWIEAQVADMADSITYAMVWAQEGMLT